MSDTRTDATVLARLIHDGGTRRVRSLSRGQVEGQRNILDDESLWFLGGIMPQLHVSDFDRWIARADEVIE